MKMECLFVRIIIYKRKPEWLSKPACKRISQEEKERGKSLTFHDIHKAVCNLYGSWDALPQESRELVTEVMQESRLEELYEQYRNNEIAAKEALIDFEKDYPGATNTDNVSDIIKELKKRKE